MARGLPQQAGAAPEGPPGAMARIVARGISLAGFGFVLTQAINLGIYIVLARLATPSDFGDFAAGAVLVNIATLLVGLESGILTAIVQRRDRIDEAASTATVATFGIGFGFSLLTLAAAPLVGAYFDSSSVEGIAAACSGLLFLRTITVVPLALLQRRFSFLRRVIVEPIGVVVFGVVAIITTSNGAGAWGLVAGTYAQFVADVALSWGLLRWRPRLRQASIAMWRELAAYARHAFAATTILRVGQQVPLLLVGRFEGSAPLGQFRYAERIGSFPFTVLLSAFAYVLFPAFARIAEDPDRDRMRASFRRALRGTVLFGMPASGLTLALGKPTAILVFGDVWAQAGSASMALFLVPAAGTLGALATHLLYADGKASRVVRVHGLEIGLGTIAMAALLGPWGLIGVGAGVSISVLVGAISGLHEAGIALGLRWRTMIGEGIAPFTAAVISGAFSVVLEFAVVHAADHGTAAGLALLVAEGLAGVAVYAGLLALIAPRFIVELRETVRVMVRRRRGAGEGPEPDMDAELDAVEDGMIP